MKMGLDEKPEKPATHSDASGKISSIISFLSYAWKEERNKQNVVTTMVKFNQY